MKLPAWLRITLAALAVTALVLAAMLWLVSCSERTPITTRPDHGIPRDTLVTGAEADTFTGVWTMNARTRLPYIAVYPGGRWQAMVPFIDACPAGSGVPDSVPKYLFEGAALYEGTGAALPGAASESCAVTAAAPIAVYGATGVIGGAFRAVFRFDTPRTVAYDSAGIEIEPPAVYAVPGWRFDFALTYTLACTSNGQSWTSRERTEPWRGVTLTERGGFGE